MWETQLKTVDKTIVLPLKWTDFFYYVQVHADEGL